MSISPKRTETVKELTPIQVKESRLRKIFQYLDVETHFLTKKSFKKD